MRILLILIKVYIWIIVIWSIMTWIPGVAGSAVHNVLGAAVVPVLNLFSFATVGFIGLQGMIVIVILWVVESWLEKKLKEREKGLTPAPEPTDAKE